MNTAWAQTLTGTWQGRIDLPEAPLAIGITLVDDADAPTGTIDIPAQGIDDLPLTDVARSGDNLISLQGVPGTPVFDGTVAGTGKATRIAGDFTQTGQTFPFALERGVVAAVARPQEPKSPFPYRNETVQLRNGEVTLAGTLTLPEGKGPFAAVLFITGSGPQDRD